MSNTNSDLALVMINLADKYINSGDWVQTIDGESLVIYRPKNVSSSKRIIIYKGTPRIEFNEDNKQNLISSISMEDRDKLLGHRKQIDLSTF
ncbi:MAG: hypothetical protein ACHQ1D_01630 [Nitrososphaerales archaeon]|jgi:hypothetical protein